MAATLEQKVIITMAQENSVFNKALRNMTQEAAYGAAIRHFTDEGLSVREIYDTLTYPVSYETIQRTVFEYMITSGILLKEKPPEGFTPFKTEFVLDEDEYGRKSYRRVVSKAPEDEKTEYIPCDFGLFDENTLEKIKAALPKKEWEYIDGIPWLNKRMYHKATPKMKDIERHLKDISEQSDK